MTQTRVAQGPKDDPAKVARDAYAGLMKGEEKVVVGSVKAVSQVASSAVLSDGAARPHDRADRPPGSLGLTWTNLALSCSRLVGGALVT